MTQVNSSGGARAPFRTPVGKGKAGTKKIAVPRTPANTAVAAVPPTATAGAAAAARHGTSVSFGSTHASLVPSFSRARFQNGARVLR